MKQLSTMNKICVVFFCVGAFLCGTGNGFPNGAPTSVCRSMLPSHRSQPSTDPSPYVITVHQESYGRLDQIDVTINSTTGATFKGFLLTAKAVSGREAGQVVGSFVTPARHSGMKKTCQNKAMTQDINRVQTSITAKWRAPYRTVGPVVFHATVIEKFLKYWVDITSSPLAERVQV